MTENFPTKRHQAIDSKDSMNIKQNTKTITHQHTTVKLQKKKTKEKVLEVSKEK